MQNIRYRDDRKWPVGADGPGHTLVLRDLHLDSKEPESWTQSPELGGSPGQPNVPPGGAAEDLPALYFNELQRGSGSGDGWVEIYNGGTSSVDLSGHTLGKHPDASVGYSFAKDTSIDAGGYLVVEESESLLEFSTFEVRFFLFSPDGTVIAATVFARRPDALDDFAQARFPHGAPETWVTLTPTPCAPNRVERVTDVVINEIFYHPPEDRVGEFLELYNPGDGAVDVSGFSFTGGIGFIFDKGTVLGPGEYLVIAENPQLIEKHYGIQGVLGPYLGRLVNGGEKILLVDTLGNTVDEVRYYDGGRWSPWADARGSSLEIIDPR